jgi:hypothetical protein
LLLKQLKRKLAKRRSIFLINKSNNRLIILSKRLEFVKLDKELLRLVIFTDLLFANNTDYTSQINYIIVLANKNNNTNILYWSSTKYKKIIHSVLAFELYAISHGFDISASLKSIIKKILGFMLNLNILPLIIYTDSKSVYNYLVKLSTAREKRLIVDLMCLY